MIGRVTIAEAPVLPRPRGQISALLIDTLRGPVHAVAPLGDVAVADPLADEDLQLALYVAYELHYRGFAGVDDGWEWEPSLIAVRRALESVFEAALVARVGDPCQWLGNVSEIDLALRAIADTPAECSLSRHVQHAATRAQVDELLIHRSAYQLKEADPHSWVLPRLHGRPKAALVEIQADEYGGGRPARMHAQLFENTLRAAGLDWRYGAYLDRIPGVTLATVNLMSMLGLQRRWRGAIVGHLALFEMMSSIPNRRYSRGLARLGLDATAREFFDVHVVADAVHENVAAVDMAGGLAAQEPALIGSILWGARALAATDAAWEHHVLAAWQSDRSSLLDPGPAQSPAELEVAGAAA